jgi:transposase-like protein
MTSFRFWCRKPVGSHSSSAQTKAQHKELPQKSSSELGRLPEVKEQIIEMSINGSGVRDIARVLKISPTTVIEELKKKNQPCTM